MEKNCERGSTTMLCLCILLPLILFLLTASLEVSSFLELRESAARILDNTARLALRNESSLQATQAAVQASLKPLSPVVNVTDVVETATARMRSIDVKAQYRPRIAALLFDLIGSPGSVIPFSLRSKVERVPFEATIVFDRFVPTKADPCSDPAFGAIKEFVVQLTLALTHIGVEKITLGAVPGDTIRADLGPEVAESHGVSEVFIDGRLDGFLRCGGPSVTTGVREAITSVRATNAKPVSMQEIVSGLSELLLADGKPLATRKQLFYLITREGVVSWSGLEDAIAALNAVAREAELRVALRRITVGPRSSTASLQSWDRPVTSETGVDSRIFSLMEFSDLGRSFVTALVGRDDVVVLAE